MMQSIAEHLGPRERLLLEALAMAGVGMWEWEASTDRVLWSPELCRMYGFDPETFEHDFDRFFATVVADDRPLVKQAIEAAFTAGTAFDFELRVVREDGTPRTLHATGRVTLDDADRPVRILGTTQDVTERRRAERALTESERRFRTAFDDAPIGMALVALDGRMLRVNHAFSAMTGRAPAELLRVGFQEITHPDDLEADVAHVQSLIDGESDSYVMEKRYLHADGSVVWSSLSVSLVRDDEGAPEYFVSQVRDISESRRLREHLHHLADHDGLTQLRNRRRFDEDLGAQVARAQRYGESAALLILDLDKFKGVNDTHGHRAGDEVLRQVARCITNRLRSGDVAARLGGDEFAVLLPHTSQADARRVGEQLAEAIARTAGYGVTASVGVASLDLSDASAEDLLIGADRAMYAAKALRPD